MIGLEVALDQVTDRSGRRMRDKIEGTTAIDDLIVANDSGPMLQRALDNVEHTEPVPPGAGPEPMSDAAPTEPAGGETPPSQG
jgi:hypothetical protein